MLKIQSSKAHIGKLELHISHGCNLKCQYCAHFSNYGHKGLLSKETAEEWIKTWSSLISPKEFNIMGGEPTINKELCEILVMTRKYFTHHAVCLLTNGFFLDRHPELDQVLYDNNILLKISLHAEHGKHPDYDEKMEKIGDYVKNFKCRWKYVHCYRKWRAHYQGCGSTMMPFTDNNQRASWEQCFQNQCFQLHENKIWKCPHIAYLEMQYKKYNLDDVWKPYLAYQALKPDCSQKELLDFISREDEFICQMCPASVQNRDKGNPLVTLT